MPWYARLLCGMTFVPVAFFAVFLAVWFTPLFGPFYRYPRVLHDLLFMAVWLLVVGGAVAWLLYMANTGLWRSRFSLRTRVAWIAGISAVGVLIVGGAIVIIIVRYMPP